MACTSHGDVGAFESRRSTRWRQSPSPARGQGNSRHSGFRRIRGRRRGSESSCRAASRGAVASAARAPGAAPSPPSRIALPRGDGRARLESRQGVVNGLRRRGRRVGGFPGRSRRRRRRRDGGDRSRRGGAADLLPSSYALTAMTRTAAIPKRLFRGVTLPDPGRPPADRFCPPRESIPRARECPGLDRLRDCASGSFASLGA